MEVCLIPLLHTFYLIPNHVHPRLLAQYKNNPEDVHYGKIEIKDESIQLLYPTFEQIPTRNPTKSTFPAGNGIHYYGMTVFDHTSSPLLKKMCLYWKNLYQHTSTHIQAENEQLTVEKDIFLYQINVLLFFANQVQTGHYYIYHMGI